MQEQRLLPKQDSKMSSFQTLKSDNDLKEILKAAFDANLDITGDWGYTKETATIIQSCSTTRTQFEHMFASMRAYIEMNMTQEKNARYGSINVNERTRTHTKQEGKCFDQVTYEVTAMKEEVYAAFIADYKEGYGKDTFDLDAHFKARKEATLYRKVTHWFEVSLVR